MNLKYMPLQRIHCLSCLFLLFCLFNVMKSQEESTGLPTVTVRGFLNFKTTVDGTVIVFTPVSEMHPPSPVKMHPPSTTSAPSMNNEGLDEDVSFASPPQNSIEPLKTHSPSENVLENKMEESFLPHISDNAVLPPPPHNDKIKSKSSSNQFPTGLVTVLGSTSVDGSSTAVHETKVIGTYIDGKYAQILQSTSRVLLESELKTPHMVSYSTIDRSYSTWPVSIMNDVSSDDRAVSLSTNTDPTSFSVKPTTDPISFSIKGTTDSTSFTVKGTPSTDESTVSSSIVLVTSSFEMTPLTTATTQSTKVSDPKTISVPLSPTVSKEKTFDVPLSPTLTLSQQESLSSSTGPSKTLISSSKVKNTPELESSVLLRSSFDIVYSSSVATTETLETAKKTTPSLPPVASITFSEDDNMVPTVIKSYRNSSTTSRTRFPSFRRPSQTVRLNRFKVKLNLRQDSHDDESFPADDEDLDEEQIEMESENVAPTIDPAKVVFQETTITSQVTLHVGRRKSIRILTITTSVPLTVHPTDIQDMTSLEDEESDPYHHVETRTFTSTERALKTSIVPVYDGKTTSYHKVTESFFIMKYITAYRTLPIGGEVTLLENEQPDDTTLDAAAANIQPSVTQSPPEQFSTQQPSGNPPLSNPFLSLGHALSNNPLAAVYLGLQQLNAQMTLYSTITDTSTYVTTETFYNTKTVRFYDGRANKFRTVSEPTSTKKVTMTTTVTSLQPYLNTQALQQQQHLQQFIAPTRQEPQFNTITSTYTTVSTATSLSTRIYTLIYNGFSTKFRTVTSTSTYPTTVVVTSTTKVPLVATAAPFAYPYSS
ncbi:mucin-2 isoform X1 [Parasteatoda tepidariorum]|uniref:mucin-2 isoform X1 n=2 Tax=Parasteatoda tepidariorum TaxID=114398 RepID=UPI0039BCD21A